MVLAAIGLVFLLDLITKQWVISSGLPYQINSGGAFSLLIGWTQFSVLATLVFLVLIGSWAYTHKKGNPAGVVDLGFSLMIGGALANLLDRWVRGGVVDFISLWVFPRFNFADVAIVAGLILIIGLPLVKLPRHGLKFL